MKDFKFITWVGAALLIVYLIAEYNKPKPVNWNTTLYFEDKIPFGTHILYTQLNDIFPGSKVSRTNAPLYNMLQQPDVQGNYLIIAKSITVDRADYDKLVNFIKKGNNVFMTAFYWDGRLADTLDIAVSADYKKDLALTFVNPVLKGRSYSFKRDIAAQYFSGFDTVKAKVIGQNTRNHATFISFAFGKGHLYLCTNPQLFTNYSLLTSAGAEYAGRALSYLPKNQNVYWDQYQNKDISIDESPLRVIFSHDGLRWAYSIGMLTALFYIVYEVKRRQRVIPVIEPLQNSTLDFVNVVGQVYYEKRDNADIAHKKITYLLEFLRSRYFIKTSILNQEFTELLINKTGTDAVFAPELVNHIIYVAQQNRVTDKELIQLNHLIEKFYAQAGK